MIKRYMLGRTTLAKTDKVTLEGAGIVESPDGEFVLYEDVEALLESIGAGGVSAKRITKKALEEHREEFESWAKSESYDIRFRHGYLSAFTDAAWKAWLAASGATNTATSKGNPSNLRS